MSSELDHEMFAAIVARKDTATLVSQASRVAAKIGLDAASLLASLGFIGRIAINSWVETARIERRQANFTIRFGEKFLKDHVGNIRDFSYVLAHELTHLALNHLSPVECDLDIGPFKPRKTTDPESVSYKQSINEVAADMEVCKALHAIWGSTPDIIYRDRKKGVINGLLSTPEVILGEEWRTGDHLNENDVFFKFCKRCAEDQLDIDTLNIAELSTLYKEFWDGSEMSRHDLAEALELLLLPLRSQLTSRSLELLLIRVSTDSDKSAQLSDSILSKLSPKLRNILKEALRKNQRKGGCGSELELMDIADPVDKDLTHAIARILRQQLSASLSGKQKKKDYLLDGLNLSPRHLNRKEALFLAAGYYPAVYPAFEPEASPDPMPLVVYVDVSGSTVCYWRSCIEAIRRVFRERKIQAWQFSNLVVPFNVDREQNLVHSTGGTNDCFLEHAAKNVAQRHNPIFVLTDGFFEVNRRHVTSAKKHGLKFQFLVITETRQERQEVSRNLRQTCGSILGAPGIIDLSEANSRRALAQPLCLG